MDDKVASGFLIVSVGQEAYTLFTPAKHVLLN